MLTLGLIDSKPSSVALVDDGRIIAAVAEERLCRMKMAGGMPVAAMDETLRIAGASPSDVDRVAVAQVVSVFEPEPIALTEGAENQLCPTGAIRKRRNENRRQTYPPLLKERGQG